MATITFAAGTVIPSTWLNDVNALVYGAASPPANPIRVTSAGNISMAAPSSGTTLAIDTVTGQSGLSVDAAASQQATILFSSAGTARALIGTSGTAGQVITDSGNNDLNILSQGARINFSVDSGATSALRLDSTGNLLITGIGALGYGTSSGGTVTQATSKSTSVTLNKSNGQIVMNNAALGATTKVAFLLNNTTVAATDVVNVSIGGGVASGATYRVWVGATAAGVVTIVLENYSGGSLSEAVQINFAVLKAVTA